MIVHIRGADAKLEPVPDDEGHWGDATSAYGTLYTTRDEALEVGLWEFVGEQRTAPQDGYEEVVVVLDGSAEVECDGETYRLTAGDIIVYDCPIGGKRIRSDGAFRAAYVVRYRQRDGGGE
jgi:quercetin dioxygenase-like cupin family protein